MSLLIVSKNGFEKRSSAGFLEKFEFREKLSNKCSRKSTIHEREDEKRFSEILKKINQMQFKHPLITSLAPWLCVDFKRGGGLGLLHSYRRTMPVVQTSPCHCRPDQWNCIATNVCSIMLSEMVPHPSKKSICHGATHCKSFLCQCKILRPVVSVSLHNTTEERCLDHWHYCSADSMLKTTITYLGLLISIIV